jgi:hypothetical protein
MSRIAFAAVVGLAGFFAYVVAAVTLADRLVGWNWAVQAAYFVCAGMLWVIPAHFLILWAGRK